MSNKQLQLKPIFLFLFVRGSFIESDALRAYFRSLWLVTEVTAFAAFAAFSSMVSTGEP